MLNTFILLFFNVQSAFSGQTLFGDLFYALYDQNLTNVAVVAYLAYEQDLSLKSSKNEHSLGFKMSQFYKHCRDNVANVLFRDMIFWYLYSVASAFAIC